MPNQRLELEISGKATGQAEIDQLTKAFNDHVAAVESGSKRITDASQKQAAATGLAVVASRGFITTPIEPTTERQIKAIETATESVHNALRTGAKLFAEFTVGGLASAAALAQNATAAASFEVALNRVRVARLGVAAVTGGIGAVAVVGAEIGAAIAIEKIALQTIEQNKLNLAQAEFYQANKLSIGTIQELGEVVKRNGGSLDLFASALGKLGPNAGVRELGAEFSRLSEVRDPLERVKQTFSEFGSEVGGKLLPFLDDRFATNAKRISEWGFTIGTEARGNMAEFSRDLHDFKVGFQTDGDFIELSARKLGIALTEAFADSYVGLKRLKELGDSTRFGVDSGGGRPRSGYQTFAGILSPGDISDQARALLAERANAAGVETRLSATATGFVRGKGPDSLEARAARYAAGGSRDREITRLEEKVLSDRKLLFPETAEERTKSRLAVDLQPGFRQTAETRFLSNTGQLTALKAKKQAEKDAQDAKEAAEKEAEAKAKSISERLAKLQKEEVAKRAEFRKLSDGTIIKAVPLPSQQEYNVFANTPGVTEAQKRAFAKSLQPRFVLESRALAQSAIVKQREDAEKSVDELRKAQGLDPTGGLATPEYIERAERNRIAFGQFTRNEADKKASEFASIQDSTLQNSQTLSQNKLLGAFQVQNIREGPGSEIQQASVLLAIKKQNQQEIYDRERNNIESRYKFDETLEARLLELRSGNALKVHELELEAATRVAEIQEKRAGEIRNTFAEGVISLQGGGKSFSSFVLGQAQNLEKTVLSNLAGVVAPGLTGFPVTKDPNSLLGKLAKGTIFGADQAQSPLQGAGVILSSSGFKLDQAAAHLEQAAVAIVSSSVNFPSTGGSGTDIYGNTIPDAGGLSTFGSDTNGLTGAGGILGKIGPLSRTIGSIPGLPGGSAIGGILGTLSTLQKALGGDSGAPSVTSAELGNIGVFSPTVAGGTVGGGAAAHSNPLLNPLGALFSSGSSTSDKLGAGVAVIGAGVAGVNGVRDILQGGPRGIAGGIGQISGAAAALDPEPISKGILAGVAVVSGIVSSLLPDPKLLRQQGITRELRDNTYHPPSSLALTFGSDGFASDFDASGNARSSRFSNFPVNNTPGNIYRFNNQDISVPGRPTNPYVNQPTVIINMSNLDSKSIIDRSQDIGDAVRVALQSGHAVASEIQSLPGR